MSSAVQHYNMEFDPQILSAPILIVEDNEISRLFLEKTLKSAGFSNVQSVTGAQEALQHLTHSQPELIILDIIMSGMDGFACCDAIRKIKKCQHLPILMQTVITEPELRVKAFSLGATDFISKPVFPAELCARVRVHLERSLSIKSLEQYKDRIENELYAARELQRSILPQSRDIEAIGKYGKIDVAAFFQPSSEIGGDCWGTKTLRPHHQQGFWLADFSGHGVASALNTFRL